MNLKEFKLKKPEFVKEAKGCKSESEFTKLAEKHGIKFGSGCLEKAYNLFCEPKVGKLSDDDLENVSGGVSFNIAQLGLGYSKDTFLFTDK